ncbi:uncharacterized protein CHSO_1996 [Chryseobacterium sp. StRB126]|uniref:hypothetical protein n=1 Tax=Chryseobacterium sp. StRB126 TaxID=878220 RepID=UPI0004E9963F|nr:hypothetical protein [Chryseobacterium sp. StRB126]BAP31033.1 uncharacterized protein CHSO_1996 [Chryseobacterium sp. StRB126]
MFLKINLDDIYEPDLDEKISEIEDEDKLDYFFSQKKRDNHTLENFNIPYTIIKNIQDYVASRKAEIDKLQKELEKYNI